MGADLVNPGGRGSGGAWVAWPGSPLACLQGVCWVHEPCVWGGSGGARVAGPGPCACLQEYVFLSEKGGAVDADPDDAHGECSSPFGAVTEGGQNKLDN